MYDFVYEIHNYIKLWEYVTCIIYDVNKLNYADENKKYKNNKNIQKFIQILFIV